MLFICSHTTPLAPRSLKRTCLLHLLQQGHVHLATQTRRMLPPGERQGRRSSSLGGQYSSRLDRPNRCSPPEEPRTASDATRRASFSIFCLNRHSQYKTCHRIFSAPSDCNKTGTKSEFLGRQVS